MQKSKFAFLIHVISLCSFSTLLLCQLEQNYDNIYSVDTFDLLAQEVINLTNTDLVVFDVDGVLLIEQDAIFGVKAKNKILWNKLFCSEKRIPTLSSEEGKYLYSIVREQSVCIPVDKKVIQIIENIQKKKVKIIALTAIKTGKKGVIKKTEDWRFNQLKSIGIDFSTSFSLNEPLMLVSDKTKNQIGAMHHVCAKKGIVFTGEYSKSEVLKSFLITMHWFPSRIIFIDDTKSLLESVAKMCKSLNIEFLGFHYTGAEKMSNIIDEEVANFQVDYLFDYQQWLSDEQAKMLLQELKHKQEV